jgi:hypothetical protein
LLAHRPLGWFPLSVLLHACIYESSWRALPYCVVLISIVAIFLLVVPFLLYSWQPLVLSILFSYWSESLPPPSISSSWLFKNFWLTIFLDLFF